MWKRPRVENKHGCSGISDSIALQSRTCHRSFKSFFANEELSDCIVETSNGKPYQCHKVVLAAASPVFRAMFTSTMTEGTSSRVHIHEVSPQAVDLLLRLIYGRPVDVPVQLCLEFFKLADQYQVKKAADRIATAVADALSPEAVCELLPRACRTLGHAAVITQKLVGRASGDIAALPEFQQFHSWDLGLLQEVLKAPGYSHRTYYLLLAAAKWVKHAWDSRHRLWQAELMPLIDFQCLTAANLKDFHRNHMDLLKLEGLGNALFERSCSKLVHERDGFVQGYTGSGETSDDSDDSSSEDSSSEDESEEGSNGTDSS
eukprot:GHUV01005735.1.p1 GENE.GHUV01005735.1~~GHUV01005735.1.p1  ORF type:complete len:317 (+),score=90.43 GHUV01005735.1:880-1830(+)